MGNLKKHHMLIVQCWAKSEFRPGSKSEFSSEPSHNSVQVKSDFSSGSCQYSLLGQVTTNCVIISTGSSQNSVLGQVKIQC